MRRRRERRAGAVALRSLGGRGSCPGSSALSPSAATPSSDQPRRLGFRGLAPPPPGSGDSPGAALPVGPLAAPPGPSRGETGQQRRRAVLRLRTRDTRPPFQAGPRPLSTRVGEGGAWRGVQGCGPDPETRPGGRAGGKVSPRACLGPEVTEGSLETRRRPAGPVGAAPRALAAEVATWESSSGVKPWQDPWSEEGGRRRGKTTGKGQRGEEAVRGAGIVRVGPRRAPTPLKSSRRPSEESSEGTHPCGGEDACTSEGSLTQGEGRVWSTNPPLPLPLRRPSRTSPTLFLIR